MSVTQSATPTLFLSHGSPAFALADLPVTSFWETLPAWLQPLPAAVLCISAHWETANPRLSGITAPRKIQHDFYGFPPALYELRWPDGAESAPEIADTILGSLADAGIKTEVEDRRPLDHGVWVPLLRAWPEAPVPVIQLSLCPRQGAHWHWRFGEALAPLRRRGVLILGSGGIVHNLACLDWDNVEASPPDWAVEFMAALEPAILSRDEAYLCRPWALPNGRTAVPTLEHYLPLLVALAAGGDRVERLHATWTHGSLGCHAYAGW